MKRIKNDSATTGYTSGRAWDSSMYSGESRISRTMFLAIPHPDNVLSNKESMLYIYDIVAKGKDE
jgi:hypothetical protein